MRAGAWTDLDRLDPAGSASGNVHARRSRLALGLVATLSVLAGCASGGAPSTPSAPPVVANPNTPALVAQREAAGLPDCQAAPAALPVTGGLPSLTLPCLGSDKAVNLSEVRGPLVINVWAQWCQPCRDEAPVYATFAARASGKVALLGVDYDDPDAAGAVRFAGSSGWRYPHVVDASRALSPTMQIVGIPVTLFVAADGRVVYRRTGGIASADELSSLVAEHLGVTV